MPRSAPGGRDVVLTGLVFLLALVALAVQRDRSAPDYRLSEKEAIAAAQRDPRTAGFLERQGYTRAESIPLDRTLRRVTFFDGPRIVLDAAVDPGGRVRFRQEHLPGQPEAGSRVANSPWVLGLLAGLFVLATAVAPLRRLRNLDVLALASFAITIVLLNDRLVVASTAAASVPLVYLIGRCMSLGLGRPGRADASVPLYDFLTRRWDARRRSRLLALVTGATATAFLAITLTSTGERDVATASLAGATDLLHGRLPYGHGVEGVVHADTYPLLTYVSYIPGAALTPVTDAFSDRSGALVVAALASAVAAAGLYRAAPGWRGAAGGRAREREHGARLAGLRAVLAWLAFPPVLVAASSGSNDMVLAALLAWLLVVAGARRATLLLAAAAWVKVAPLVLVPGWLSRLRGRELARAVAAAAALSAALCGWLLLLGGAGAVGDMLDALTFQFERSSFHAPWRPFGIEWMQLVVQAALIATIVRASLRIRSNPALAADGVRMAALAGALLLWVQLAANYWTWAYLPWAFPFVAAALLAGLGTREASRAGTGP